jgi:hypothetical protein
VILTPDLDGAHTTGQSGRDSYGSRGTEIAELKLEVVVCPSPTSTGPRASMRLGFRMDIDHVAGEDFRVVQLTPPGSVLQEVKMRAPGR